MEALPWALCGVLSLSVIVLLIKLRLMKKSADEILSAFVERLSTDTNTLIDVPSRDRHMRALAAGINVQLRLLREERHRYCRGDAELKEAVTNISHDLRTPLTAVCGYLDLLEKEEKSDAVSRYIGMIENRVGAIRQLTEELFRYSVIVSVNEEKREKVSLGAVLEESLVSFYGVMRQKEIVPVISISKEKAERLLDRSALSRIFDNIIGNALKYSDGDLEVAMDAQGTVVFSNTAAALDAVSVGKLFDRFYTVETGRSSTGLGLSIAKLLTERMGGTISAEYRDNRLSISLTFPK